MSQRSVVSGAGWEPVIGLEIHVQLATESKLFCACATAFGASPNTQVCAVCLGLPGALPLLNRRAVELGVQLGLAVGGKVHCCSRFARKHYFYPDLPKAYQISQYDRPLCEGGSIAIEGETGPRAIALTRIHLEEDAGKLVHEGGAPRASYVDLNRAGTPLVEIVSEPQLYSAREARRYMEAVHRLVRHLELSHGDLEKGNLRADANVSLRPRGSKTLGTRTELKNINSFRFVEQGIEAEVRRQLGVLGRGERVVQETRLYDPLLRQTRGMRSKEEAQDYRYFDEPDLPPLRLSEGWVAALGEALAETPLQLRARLQDAYGLSAYDAEVLGQQKGLAAFFEATVAAGAEAKAAANWVMGDFSAHLNAEKLDASQAPVSAEGLAGLLGLIGSGAISGKIGKEVFTLMWESGAAAEAIVAERGWRQVSDVEALGASIDAILAEHPAQLEQYRQGRTKVFGFFVGQVMKATGGQGNPRRIRDLLRARLDGESGRSS